MDNPSNDLIKVLMGNADITDNVLPGGLALRVNLPLEILERGSLAERRKRDEALVRVLQQTEWLRQEAARWEAIAEAATIERDALQMLQDADFTWLEEIADLLAADELDAEQAQTVLDELGVDVPADADEDELMRLLTREQDRLRLQTIDRQREIKAWNDKITEARQNAKILREKADGWACARDACRIHSGRRICRGYISL